MSSWNDVLADLQSYPAPVDLIRRKHLAALHNKTGRNTIAYYSAFLSKQGINKTAIDDDDMVGFVNAVDTLDTTTGLDLVLHTPGGSVTATEHIVNYLRNSFGGDMRVIIPQMAMSCGTMICCAAKKILMGENSCLGPTDPGIFNWRASDIDSLATDAKENLRNGNDRDYWITQLNRIDPTLVYTAKYAIDLSKQLVAKWLGTGMFDEAKDVAKIDCIVKELSDRKNSLEHSRHFGIAHCQKIGLDVIRLEDDQELREIVMDVHYAYDLTFGNTNSVKIIENHLGKARVLYNVG